MFNNRDFWNETKSSFRLMMKRPAFILVPITPAVIFSLILYLSRVRRFSWISSYFQTLPLTALGILGIFVGFLSLSFLIALVWDYQYRGVIDFRRAYRIIISRISDVSIVSLALGFLVGFFSIWFVFPGFFLAFLLLFSLPAIVIGGDDPFSAVKTSFRMVYENLAEVFAFFILSLSLCILGYLLSWLIGFIPLIGIFINIILIAFIMTYLSILITRFYLTLTRY